ncbi:MAG: hypothetical protein J2P37_23670, partial [Ktedonobacteraceae bacterium]|nr:hypothetical protein [Ktedonobacteraceae bacterium]
MMTLSSPQRFPYGQYVVDPMVRQRYQQAAPQLAERYALPTSLPRHHFLLQRVCRLWQVSDAPAPWWPDFLTSLEDLPEAARSLLRDLSTQEFRSGTIQEQRWRHVQQHCGGSLQGQPLTSPKLTHLLEDTCWNWCFQQRGPQETPTQFDLVLSCAPEYVLNMSNGAGWQSCMHAARGSCKDQLPGNFYDTGVAVALLLPQGASIWEEQVVIARTTLRVVRDLSTNEPLIALGRMYQNNLTAATLFLQQLIMHLEQAQLRWGCITMTNTHSLLMHGAMGKAYQQFFWQECATQGEAFWLPQQWQLPYIDGGLS